MEGARARAEPCALAGAVGQVSVVTGRGRGLEQARARQQGLVGEKQAGSCCS